ncbi:MAG: class I SAM-dependent methyltransferase [Holosporales bacterium]
MSFNLKKLLKKYFLVGAQILVTISVSLADKHHTYKEIFLTHTENCSDKWDGYFKIYDEAFQSFIGESPNVLEIGVQNGGSLQNWKRYFVNGVIYGIDIDPKVCKVPLGEGIYTYCFNATDPHATQKNLNDLTFDCIIDDGSHFSSDVIASLKIFFKRLKPGGVYVIEDLHTSYWSSHGGGLLKKGTSIEFLKKIVDLMNHDHIQPSFFSSQASEEELYFIQWVSSITFADSIAIIRKNEAPRKPLKRIIVGKKDPVVSVFQEPNNRVFYYPPEKAKKLLEETPRSLSSE